MKAPFYYRAYGLTIASDVALPLPETGRRCGDLFIHEKRNGALSHGNDEGPWKLEIWKDNEALLDIGDQARLHIRGGKDVTVYASQKTDARLIGQCLMGIVSGILLYQRKLLPLHASAVAFEGGVAAFAGNPGAGKSSAAAALYREGYRIVADDITAVAVDAESATVFPGFPNLKIGREAARVLGFDFESMDIIHPLEEKRYLDVRGRFQNNPLPLHSLFVLDDGPGHGVEALQPQEAVMELVRHTFPTRLQQPGTALHFTQCADLANRVPLYRLRRSWDLSSLRQLLPRAKNHGDL